MSAIRRKRRKQGEVWFEASSPSHGVFPQKGSPTKLPTASPEARVSDEEFEAAPQRDGSFNTLEKARRMLIHAFAGEIIDRVRCEPLREELNQVVWDRLQQNEQVAVNQ